MLREWFRHTVAPDEAREFGAKLGIPADTVDRIVSAETKRRGRWGRFDADRVRAELLSARPR